jgi:hypothetical protein
MLHRTQARIWRRRQLRLQRLVEGLDDMEEMPMKLLEELQRIDTFLGRSSGAMVAVLDAQEEAYKELPTEQLEAQLAAELVAAAGTWTAAQWALVDGARKRREQELERTTS